MQRENLLCSKPDIYLLIPTLVQNEFAFSLPSFSIVCEKWLCMCGRFLSVASLQGLIHEGTMTSLCMAMTGEQHKSVVIDCSSSQPQFYNGGEPQPLKQLSWGSWESLFFTLRTNGTKLPFLPVQFYMFIPNSPKRIAVPETCNSTP